MTGLMTTGQLLIVFFCGRSVHFGFRRGIKKALMVTEKKEEKEEEVDLLFAEDDEEDIFSAKQENEKFTPMCTPTKNRKNLLGYFCHHHKSVQYYPCIFSL